MSSRSPSKRKGTVRCYVCGKTIGHDFCIVSMRDAYDRAFTVHGGGCLQLVAEDAAVVIPVNVAE